MQKNLNSRLLQAHRQQKHAFSEEKQHKTIICSTY